MSEIRVTNVLGENGNSPVNFTKGINMSGIVTATSFVPTQGQLSHRNVIINGAMQVNQRVQTGTLGYFNPVTSSIYTLDRWKLSLGGSFDTDSAKIYHSTTAPSSEGFTKSLKVDIGNTETPSSGQRANIGQRIEGQNLQHLRYGTSSAKTMTLSFWVYSNKTGTYSVQVIQEGKYVLFDYTISSADTWEKKTITIVGNTADAIPNDNTVGLYVDWFLCANSDVSVSPTSSWTSGGSYRASTNQVNLWDNANNYWYLTGVQLEVGPVATPFEHKNFREQLSDCQRYFFNIKGNTNAFMGIAAFANSTSTARFAIYFPVPMRTNPTYTGSGNLMFDANNDSATFAASSMTIANGTSAYILNTGGISSVCLEMASTSNMQNNSGGGMIMKSDPTTLNFSAEL